MNPRDQIREHMMVHARGGGGMGGARGRHVGTVDGLENDRIKLTRDDSPDGRHHFIPLDWVESVEGDTVHLKHDADTVMSLWRDENSTDGMDAGGPNSPGMGAAAGGGGSANLGASGMNSGAMNAGGRDAAMSAANGSGLSASQTSMGGPNSSLGSDRTDVGLDTDRAYTGMSGDRTTTNSGLGVGAMGSGAGSALEGSRMDRELGGTGLDASRVDTAANERGAGANMGVDPASMPRGADRGDLGGDENAAMTRDVNEDLYDSDQGRTPGFGRGADHGHRDPSMGSNTPDAGMDSNMSGYREMDADDAVASGRIGGDNMGGHAIGGTDIGSNLGSGRAGDDEDDRDDRRDDRRERL